MSLEPSSLPAPVLPLEIERKFLLSDCPVQARAVAPSLIEQGWLPGERIRERLRRRTAPDGQVTFWRTIKLGDAAARIEIEEAADSALFDGLWPLTSARRVRKHRHVLPAGHRQWEIDVFLDRDLVLAEIELEHIDEPVDIPAWLAPYVVRDVTDDPAYLNARLARPEADGPRHG